MASKGKKKISLRDLTAQLPDENEILPEILGDSDQACALVSVAILDRALMALLTTQMAKVGDDDLKPMFYGMTAFLGSFSNKIRLCLALGLITKKQATHLNTMREIRNYFAHALGPPRFDVSEVVKECASLWPDDAPVPKKTLHLPPARIKFLARWRAFSRELTAAYVDLLLKSGVLSHEEVASIAAEIRTAQDSNGSNS